MTDSDEFIELTTTTSNADDAHALAYQLVQQRLAACVQVTGPIRSFYRWQGELCEADEMRVTVKSLARLTEPLIAAIESQHSYDTPQIIVTNVARCSAKYAQWLRDQVE